MAMPSIASIEVGMRAQRRERRTEQEAPGALGVDERLLAETVPRQRERPPLAIEEREREHPVAPPKRLAQAEGLDRGEEHLGVRMAAPTRCGTLGLEPGPQDRGIVDFAVQGQHVPPAARLHRLVPGLASVDDRQPSKRDPEAVPRVGVDARVVGPARTQRSRHRDRLTLELLRVRRLPAIDQPCEPAHRASALRGSRRPGNGEWNRSRDQYPRRRRAGLFLRLEISTCPHAPHEIVRIGASRIAIAPRTAPGPR